MQRVFKMAFHFARSLQGTGRMRRKGCRLQRRQRIGRSDSEFFFCGPKWSLGKWKHGLKPGDVILTHTLIPFCE